MAYAYVFLMCACCVLVQIIYVDTDTLWLDDPVWWWTHFAHIRTQHALFGLAQNANSGEGSWYTNGAHQ